MVPLKKGKILGEKELAVIFGTWPTLVSVNKSLLEALEERIGGTGQQQQGSPYTEQQQGNFISCCVGDIFLKHVCCPIISIHICILWPSYPFI